LLSINNETSREGWMKMTTEARVQITSSEVGTLWKIYMELSEEILVHDFFNDKTIDNEAKNIITSYITEGSNIKNEIANIFNNEGAVIPIGFNSEDILKDAPTLFDDIFHIMFLRQMMKLNLGFDAVYTAISYKKEVQNILKLHYDVTFKYYTMTTEYLLKKGVFAKPPNVTMPKQVEFVEDKSYMSGFNPFSQKRTLNTIEVGYIYESLEFNVFFMKLLTGFAQVAKDSAVKKYFLEGMEIGKKNIDKLSSALLQSNIQPSCTWAGMITESTIPPFSDKLMMYIVNMLSTTPLSYSALGTSYSFRNDLPLLLAVIAKSLFTFAKEGGKLMIEHKWMEEPPQMEDRNQLILH
jgi:hypothetical protein